MKTYPSIINIGLIIFFSMIILNILHGQNLAEKPTYPWSRKTEIGLNMTNLATRFIPLNFNNQAMQDIAFKFRKYRRTNAFKLDIGARVTDDNSPERQFLFFGAGIERRRNIWENKWTYVSSFDFNVVAGPINSFIGIARVYGIEYAITPHVYVSTQTSLALGFNIENGGGFRFLPPNSVFLNVRF